MMRCLLLASHKPRTSERSSSLSTAMPDIRNRRQRPLSLTGAAAGVVGVPSGIECFCSVLEIWHSRESVGGLHSPFVFPSRVVLHL